MHAISQFTMLIKSIVVQVKVLSVFQIRGIEERKAVGGEPAEVGVHKIEGIHTIEPNAVSITAYLLDAPNDVGFVESSTH